MRLADLTAARLREVAPALSDEHRASLATLAQEHAGRVGSSDVEAEALFVPGRIELLGKHTDYAGGRSLTCATEQGFCVVATAHDDGVLKVSDLERDERVEIEVSADLEVSAGDWGRYVETVVRRLARDFGGDVGGAELTLASDLPRSSGMSSSSALVISLSLGMATTGGLMNRLRESFDTPESLAGYLAAVESGAAFGPFAADRGVGTHGGSEDHTAILCSTAGYAGLFGYAPVRRERSIPMPESHTLVVASSGVRAKKTGDARAAYNRASAAAATAARLWRDRTGGEEPHLAAIVAKEGRERLLEATAEGSEELDGDLLRDRVEHFYQESEVLVPQAAEALAAGDTTLFGLLVDRSQHLARRLLGNQIPETVSLAEIARELGAVAASSFGAGFGGAVWALVEASEADEFAASWLEDYLDAFPEHEDEAIALITGAGGAACRVTDGGLSAWS